MNCQAPLRFEGSFLEVLLGVQMQEHGVPMIVYCHKLRCNNQQNDLRVTHTTDTQQTVLRQTASRSRMSCLHKLVSPSFNKPVYLVEPVCVGRYQLVNFYFLAIPSAHSLSTPEAPILRS
jgi:hypothetical protein